MSQITAIVVLDFCDDIASIQFTLGRTSDLHLFQEHPRVVPINQITFNSIFAFMFLGRIFCWDVSPSRTTRHWHYTRTTPRLWWRWLNAPTIPLESCQLEIASQDQNRRPPQKKCILSLCHYAIKCIVIVSSPWIGSSVSLHSWWSLSRSFHTFVMMRGVSRSLPPTRRIPQGVCWPSRSNVTATSLILCILHWDSHSTAGALNGLQLLVLIIFYNHPLLS